MVINKSFFALLAFLAAFLFFILAAFAVTLGDVPLVPAGLTALAAGFVIDHAP
jgi:hypothetical protein